MTTDADVDRPADGTPDRRGAAPLGVVDQAAAALADGPHVVLVTGRAGAGRTTAINALEDYGYERIDRPPIGLIAQIVSELQANGRRRIVIGVDAKTAGFSSAAFLQLRASLSRIVEGPVRMVFLDVSDEALRRRYTETRRRHPLAPSGSIEEGIKLEREMTDLVREQADIVIDTSSLTPSELKRTVFERVLSGDALGLSISIVSFAYRNGLPPEADLVFDCRFLRNPHYEPALKPLDGRTEEVAEYVAQDPLYAPFHAGVMEMTRLLLPAFRREGKSYLTIAFGCTGGQHRSVALAEATAASLRADGWSPILRHRERAGKPPRPDPKSDAA